MIDPMMTDIHFEVYPLCGTSLSLFDVFQKKSAGLKDRFALQRIPDREPELQCERVWFNADCSLVIIGYGIGPYTLPLGFQVRLKI